MKQSHSWEVGLAEARRIQDEWASLVVTEDRFGEIKHIGGVDLGYRGAEGIAAMVVLTYPDLIPVDRAVHKGVVNFPYIPGLLSFREIPLILPAYEKLKAEPDILIADGQGIAHPKRLGLASHLGLVLEKPVIGCAKSRLCGQYREPARDKGSFEHLYSGEEIIGTVLRTRTDVKPLFVSTGHFVSLDTAVRVVLACCPKYRLPEPTRLAHYHAARYKSIL